MAGKRRNVIRVGITYVVIAWVLAQVAELALDSFEAPGWVIKTILLLLALGLPLALFFAWAFELTPEGIRKESEVDRSESITPQTGRKLDRVIIGVLVLAVGYFAVDDISGAEVTSLIAHSLEAGNLQVRHDIIAQGRRQVTSGINVGPAGLFSDGNVGLAGTIALADDIAPLASR